MATKNEVEYILEITGGKSKENIKRLIQELKKTQKELDDTEKKSKKSFGGMAQSAKKAIKSLKGMKRGLTGLTVVIGGAATAFFGLNKAMADSVNELVDASARSGIAVQTLSGLKLAVEGSGKSFSDLERGLDNFSKQMMTAQKGTGDTAKIMKAFGISVTDNNGQLRDSNSVFNETIDRLSRMRNITQRNAIAMKLFGRSGSALIQSGALENMDAFVEKAKELGPALDDNAIKKAAEFQRGLAELKTGFLGFVSTVLEGLTGENSIGSQMSVLAENLKGFGEGLVIFVKEIKKFAQQIHDILQPISESVGGISGILKNLPGMSGFGSFEIISKAQKEINKKAKENSNITKANQKVAKQTAKSSADIAKSFNLLGTRQEKVLFLAEKYNVALDESNMPLQRSIKELRGTEISFHEMEKAADKMRNIEINIDFGKKKPPKVKEEIKSLFDFIDEKEDPFNLDMYSGGEDALTIIEKLEDKERELAQTTKEMKEQIENANLSFAELKERVSAIGEERQPYQDFEKEIDKLIVKFTTLGQSTLGLRQLKLDIIKLRAETLKLNQVKSRLNITASIIGLAGGDIAGSLTGVLEKTLSGPALELLGPAGSVFNALTSFGAGMNKAAENKISEVQKRREENQIKKMEEALGRSLTDAEQLKAKNQAKLSEKEKERLSKQAMREKATQDVKQFTMAIETGLKMLPEILFEVLPPLLLELGASIIKALFLLPFRIAKSLAMGVFNVGAKVAEAPLNIMKSLADFFGLDSKRSGGRFTSAKRGMRFTGGQDGLAMLHRNEYVVPESGARPQAVDRMMRAQGGGGVVVNVSADIVERDAIEELVRRIEQKFQTFGSSQSTLFTG